MRAAGWMSLVAALGGMAFGGTTAAAQVPVGPPVSRPPPRLPSRPPRVGPLRPGLRHDIPRRFGLRPFAAPRGIGPNVPPLLLPPPPPDEFLQPDGPGTSPSIEGAPQDLPALAHGFHLDVTVGAGRTFAAPPVLGRFVEVGQALGRCFAPPSGLAWGSITLRVAFRRDGSVFGLPRIPYSDAATADRKSDLAHSLLAGLKRCTPLPLSPSLGAAVAGEIFAIRFIHEDER